MKKVLISLFIFSLPSVVEAGRQRLTNNQTEKTQETDRASEETRADDDQEEQERAAYFGNDSDDALLGLSYEERDRRFLARWPGWHQYMRCFIVDTLDIWKSLFSRSSMEVLTAIIPTYLATRQANYVIHKHFYNAAQHKNLKQPPRFFSKIAIADAIVAIPFVILNAYGWWLSSDPVEFRRVQVFNAGLIATLSAKLLLKECKHHDSYRPWHQDFSCDFQADNGWPSGHSAMIAYLATFWGLEKGYKWGVPFGIFTLYAMAINVVTNHHYLSQVFVGAGLGVLFGVSAHKTMQHVTNHESFYIGFASDHHGNPALRLAYDF